MKFLKKFLLLGLLAALPVFAQTNAGLQRYSNTSVINNGNVCWESTAGAGPDVCLVRSAAGVLSVTQGDAVTGASISIGSPIVAVANEGATGTTVNKLAKFTGAPSTAIIAATTDSKNGAVVGVVVGGAGITGNAQITLVGTVACAFDATAVTAGDFVTVSATVAGKCHDAGSTLPVDGSQVIGVTLATGNASTTQNIFLRGQLPVTYLVSQTTNPSATGIIRLGNTDAINWRNAANGADIGLSVNSSNLLVYGGSAPTDGYYFVPPSNCSLTLTTGTWAADANGGTSLGVGPFVLKAQTGNSVLEGTTTGAANIFEVICDLTPPSRLTSAKGITINTVAYMAGWQTTAPTSTGTAAINSVTYHAAGSVAQGTVASAGGSITPTGWNHGTPPTTTTSGQCYTESLALGTPIAVTTDLTRLTLDFTVGQTAAAATILQVCGAIVYYSNINSL